MKRLKLVIIEGDKFVEETISWEAYRKIGIGGGALLGNTVEVLNRKLETAKSNPLQKPITPLERSKRLLSDTYPEVD